MRILYLCADFGVPVLGPKGAAVHVRELVAAFGRAGHSVVVAAPLRTKSPWDEPAELQGRLLQVKPSPATLEAVLGAKILERAIGTGSSLAAELRRVLYNNDLTTQLKRRFQREPPDFMYERASLHSIAGGVVADALQVPLLVELNAPLAAEQATYRSVELERVARDAEGWLLTRADAVVAVSTPLRAHVVELGAAPERVHVVPNGVDASRFRPGDADPQLRRRLALNGGPVLGFLGGLRPWHGVEILPALLDRLRKRYPGLRLLVAGDGPARAGLEADLRARGLEASVVFTGTVPHGDVPALLRQLDAALAPYPEPRRAFYFSPLKLFEYMAVGVPVVAARVGQVAEVVRDGETGLLYPPGRLDDLVAACERLLDDAALRRRLGRAAAQDIRAHYTWDRNATVIAEIARNALARRVVAE